MQIPWSLSLSSYSSEYVSLANKVVDVDGRAPGHPGQDGAFLPHTARLEGGGDDCDIDQETME